MSSDETAMTARRQFKGRGPRCHYCRKFGHIQKNCTERIKSEDKSKQGAPAETPKGKKEEKVGLLTRHVLGVREPAQDWILDSGATCHICNSKELFTDFQVLSKPQKVTLGDEHSLEAVGMGRVEVRLKLPHGESRIGQLSDVLYVPSLAFNLLSMSKITEALRQRERFSMMKERKLQLLQKSETSTISTVNSCKVSTSTQLPMNQWRICGIGGLATWAREA